MIWVGYRRMADEARKALEDPELLEELLESDDDVTSVDLDKAWHGLHWLLTGSGEPTDDAASDAIFGGEPIGEDLGYGPGRLLPASGVSAVANVLRELDPDSLSSRMDRAAMARADLHPSIWEEQDIFDEYLSPAYERLRAFYLVAADRGEAVIQTIC